MSDPAQPAPTGQTDVIVPIPVAVAAVAAGALLAGCSSGGGGGGGTTETATPLGPVLTVTSMDVAVTTAAAAAITVNGVAATSGTAALTLGAAPLPADPGAGGDAARCNVTVVATDGAGSANSTLAVTVNPTAAAVTAAAPATIAGARHLVDRSGYGATADELALFATVNSTQAVDRILDGIRTTPVTAPPAWINEVWPTWAELSALGVAAQDAFNTQNFNRITEIKAWWLAEMYATPSPLTERLVLFWSNHLVTSASDIENSLATWKYLTLLRTHAAGSFKDMLLAICRDAAMTMYLDNESNVKGKPNENFGRELLELFTIGEGRGYTEADVVDTARAFTGWNLDARRGFLFKASSHDTGIKTILGQTGNWDGDDVIRIILEQPGTAVFIVEKLWQEFVGDDVTSPAVVTEIARIAAVFRVAWSIKAVLREIFLTSLFTDASRRATKLKPPILMLVGTYRALGVPPAKWSDQIGVLNELEQNPLDPPNVRGWQGGLTWINAKSLLDRRFRLGNLASSVASKLSAAKIADLPSRLLPIAALNPPLTGTPSATAKIQAVLLDPAFQLS